MVSRWTIQIKMWKCRPETISQGCFGISIGFKTGITRGHELAGGDDLNKVESGVKGESLLV